MTDLISQDVVPLQAEYRTIPVSGGYEAIIDSEDYELISQYNWHTSSYKPYARTNDYSKGRRNPISYMMHRMLLGMVKGDKRDVDHINGNGLDNRRCNLRICTRAENMWNRGKTKRNSSGYKGVYWVPCDRKWRTTMWMNKKKVLEANFNTKEGAARAYDSAARKYHGEFAVLNFPDAVIGGE